MEITFLGGADSIGASCAVVTLGTTRIVVDCGIRMGGEDRLPDFGLLSAPDFGAVDALLLTHAHMDHSGALPVFHQHFPAAPIYATAPTRALVEILLRDSLRIMGSRMESEGEIPLYSQRLVESTLERMIPVPMGVPQEIAGIHATWFPAGHILGAASVGIEGRTSGSTKRVLFSGDLSVASQITVPGMLPPRGFRPDVVVMESTYGNRLHSPRAAEEQRLVEMVDGVLGRGGKLLIPAFAVGRAQELTLLLIREFRRKRLHPFPVYLDGMVRSVCRVYSDFVAHQSPYPRRLAERHGNPFFGVVDEVQAVTSPDERERIVSGPPCVIISSSGMLTGGPSAFYAEMLAGDERNGIAITGYQDEESPGRHLLDLADREDKTLTLPGRTVPVRSSFAKYALSAHADANEIAGLVDGIRPHEVVLVHGDGQSRPALAELLWRRGSGAEQVHLPAPGDTLRFGPRRGRVAQGPSPAVLGLGRPLDDAALRQMAGWLAEKYGHAKAVSAIELLALWHGNAGWDEPAYADLVKRLHGSEVFVPHPFRPHLYRLRRADACVRDATSVLRAADPNELAARSERLLGPETGLYHKGWDVDRHVLRLSFAFPDMALQRWRDRIAEVVQGTGWTVLVNETPHMGRLMDTALACLPQGTPAVKTPSVHIDRREVCVTTAGPVPEDEVPGLSARLQELTGYALVLAHAGETKAAAFKEVRYEPRSLQRLSFPQATLLIQEAFLEVGEEERPTRCAARTDAGVPCIELAFMTPALARRNADVLRRLADATGWRLHVRETANTHRIGEIIHAALPEGTSILKGPSYHVATGRAGVRLDRDLSAAELERMTAEIERRTGWKVTIENPVGASSDDRRTMIEINTAYQVIQAAFSETPETSRPYKTSRKVEGGEVFVELAFLTPEVGARQRDLLDRLSQTTGYALRIKGEANQIALLSLVQRLVPGAWGLRHQAFHKTERTVRIKCASPPPTGAPAWTEVQRAFREATEYGLELE